MMAQGKSGEAGRWDGAGGTNGGEIGWSVVPVVPGRRRKRKIERKESERVELGRFGLSGKISSFGIFSTQSFQIGDV
jgi:hypothetical protein